MATTTNESSPAMSYYHQAENYAIKANELAADCRDTLVKIEELTETTRRWDSIMSNTHPVAWAIFFVIISIVEFLFSLDLYIDLLPFAPWIIPIGIIVITVFISHALAVRLMPSLRNKEFSDKKHNQLYSDKTDEQIWEEINRTSRNNMILGILGTVVISLLILWLSNERVIREIEAGMRVRPFGAYDLMPVLFYVFEIVAGILVLYLWKRTAKSLAIRRNKRKFDKMVRQMVTATDQAVKSFEKAEALGFNILERTISESIHIAFYRNKNCNPSDEKNYIAEPVNLPLTVKLRISRANSTKPVLANLHIFSEYNYAASGATNDQGVIEITYTSFANDTIKKVIAEFSDGTDSEDSGVYLTGNPVPHTILFRE